MGKLLNLKTAPPNRAALIDEFGEVSAARAAFSATEKRYEQLRTEIKSWYETADAEKTFVEKGARFQLDVSVCQNAKVIDIKAAYKKLRVAKFLKAVTLTLKSLGEFLSDPEVDALVSTSRSGPRGFAVTPIGAPAQPQGIANRAVKVPEAA